MTVSLFTSRVVLDALGVEDYGINNVVGGLVVMFSLLSGSLSSSISRFLTFELGKGDVEKLTSVFSSAVTIQLGLSVAVLLLSETVGLWFINNKLVIPESRMYAANWVFQMSLLTFIINLISVPYNAAIIAHEKMSAFAYISIIEAFGKLAIAYGLIISTIDKLILYSVLLAILALLLRLIYGIYCKRHFEECSYHFVYDHALLKKMFGFAGWNFIGSSSALFRDQGGNILINMFCGPTVNAARGIAFQVHTAINSFVSNFMLALDPQITKSYAKGEYTYMMALLFRGAKFSYYILLLLSLPILVNTEFILRFWLRHVPDHTVLFVQLVLLFGMCESISGPLITAVKATGRIRDYQLVVGGLQTLNFPISYLLLRMGAMPESVLVVSIFISHFCLFSRLYMLSRTIEFDALFFLRKVYFNVLKITVVSFCFSWAFSTIFSIGSINVIIHMVLTVLTTLLVEFCIGCTKSERMFVMERIRIIIRHDKNRRSF